MKSPVKMSRNPITVNMLTLVKGCSYKTSVPFFMMSVHSTLREAGTNDMLVDCFNNDRIRTGGSYPIISSHHLEPAISFTLPISAVTVETLKRISN